MLVTTNLLSVQCSLTSLVPYLITCFHEHCHDVLKELEHDFASLLQANSHSLPPTSQCISLLQRSGTATPARVTHSTWGMDCTWMSLKTGCRPSIWPRATTLASVSVFIKLNESRGLFCSVEASYLSMNLSIKCIVRSINISKKYSLYNVLQYCNVKNTRLKVNVQVPLKCSVEYSTWTKVFSYFH